MTDRQMETHRKTGGSAAANVKARVSKKRGAAVQMGNITSNNNNSDSYTFQLLSFIC